MDLLVAQWQMLSPVGGAFYSAGDHRVFMNVLKEEQLQFLSIPRAFPLRKYR